MKYGEQLVTDIASDLDAFEFKHCGLEETCDQCVFAVGTACLSSLVKDILGIMIDIYEGDLNE